MKKIPVRGRQNNHPAAPQNQPRNGGDPNNAAAEKLLTQLIGPVCAQESVATAKARGMSLADFVSEAVSRTDAIGAATTSLTEAERRALEFIADKEVAEETRNPHIRLEEVSLKLLSLLCLLKAAYEVSRREDEIHDQRFIGLLLLGDGLEEELLAASDLIHKEAHMLKAQRTALRALAGRQLTEKDAWRLRSAEEFKLARTLTRDEMPAKEGQVAA